MGTTKDVSEAKYIKFQAINGCETLCFLIYFVVLQFQRIFGEPTDTLSPCPFSDLAHAEFQSCRNTFDDSVLPIETVLWDSLPPFTICNYKCISNGESVSRMCENGRWTGPKCSKETNSYYSL